VLLSGSTPIPNIFSCNRMNNQSYDAAGNQTSLNGKRAVYDAENRLVTVTEQPAFGGGTESLSYDGAGQRGEKVAARVTTVYVYDAFGRLGAEYSGTATTPLPCRTCYLSYDHLGSLRMVTDPNGTVVSRHDYLPFGEEIPAGYGGRGAQFGATDNVIQRFTGQVRDSETGVDYFNARYFGAALGRFTSADPANAGADVTDPQTWSGYSSVRHSPMNAVDPSDLG
jgi:RHS repeat-associated protein